MSTDKELSEILTSLIDQGSSLIEDKYEVEPHNDLSDNEYEEMEKERQEHIEKAKKKLLAWRDKSVNEALINELETMIEVRQCYKPNCKQEHTLLRKSYVTERLAHLNKRVGK